MIVNKVIAVHKRFRFPQITKSLKITMFFVLSVLLSFGLFEYSNYKIEEKQTLAIVSKPKINDIYFLDFRVLSDKLRPKEKYRIAKVADITGDIVTLIYGSFFYKYQNAAVNSILYDHLTKTDYFETKRYNLPLNTIKKMLNDQAIYLAKRPVHNKLFGHLVSPEKEEVKTSNLIYGKKENIKGKAFLKEQFSETNLKKAFKFFQTSSQLGYAKGQVNLAQMYINGQYVEKDFNQALHWLKQASLQSNKSAILKYGIICKQINACDIARFYRELANSGVNIKVRKLDFKLDN